MSEHNTDSLRTYMDTMDEPKKLILRELRQNLKNELNPEDDDFLLLRFLKARNFDLVKGEIMLRHHLKIWKKLEFEMKDFQPHEVFQKYSDVVLLGLDTEGDPMTYMRLSSFDWKGISYSVTLIDQIKFYSNLVNEQHSASKKSKNERIGTFILDLEDISMAFASSALVIRHHMNLIQFYQAHFPETLKSCYVINVPSFFQTLYNIYKHAIDANILKKIRIFGKDGYKESLRETVDADILPVYLGGKKTDGNLEGLSTIRGEFLKIPTSYYLSSNDPDSEPGMNRICIRERSFYDHRVRVDDVNSTLKWHFHTENYNLKFGIFYVSDDVPQTPKLNRKYSKASNKTLQKVGYEPLLPVEFAECHVLPERGEYTCIKTGTYVLRFDNSFSWMTPKELSLKVDVLIPKSTKQIRMNGYHK